MKKIPKFTSEDQERDFWQKADANDYFDISKASKRDFANLKPSTTSISLRLPDSLLERIKTIAHKNDIPYQSLIKMILSERVAELSKK